MNGGNGATAMAAAHWHGIIHQQVMFK